MAASWLLPWLLKHVTDIVSVRLGHEQAGDTALPLPSLILKQLKVPATVHTIKYPGITQTLQEGGTK